MVHEPWPSPAPDL